MTTFLKGIITFYASDALWNFIGISQGLINIIDFVFAVIAEQDVWGLISVLIIITASLYEVIINLVQTAISMDHEKADSFVHIVGEEKEYEADADGGQR